MNRHFQGTAWKGPEVPLNRLLAICITYIFIPDESERPEYYEVEEVVFKYVADKTG